MNMQNLNHQKGIGLVEILVSLLLLAVAVLGFSTLQMSSLKSTDESLKRTQAMSIARGLGENMRLNIENIEKMAEVVNDRTEADGIDLQSCETIEDPCTKEQMSIKSALLAIEAAEELDIDVGVEDCPETADPDNLNSTLRCIVVAWNTTNPWTDASTRENTTNPDFINCASETGVYKTESSCIILEAY